jgi:hypothetical protein
MRTTPSSYFMVPVCGIRSSSVPMLRIRIARAPFFAAATAPPPRAATAGP